MKKQQNVAQNLVRNSWMWRWAGGETLVPMRSAMSSPMSTFSIKKREDNLSVEVAEESGATALFLRGMEGMVTPLWEGARTWSQTRVEGVAVGFSTTVVAGAAVR